eukprot:GDKJ01005422.1.p1 GENE.GDKJ01005422.1~~GDKJ01005422.1.p1  ORF type:complete len:1904 (-),score=513.02 GDKJ01005422.1:72-5783(-)
MVDNAHEQGLQMIEILRSTYLFEIVPENSKILVTDVRVPMHVLLRSLFEYKKQFTALWNDSLRQYTGIIDVAVLADFILWFYEQDSDQLLPNRTGFPSPELFAEIERTMNDQLRLEAFASGKPAPPLQSTFTPVDTTTVSLEDITVSHFLDLSSVRVEFPTIPSTATCFDTLDVLLNTGCSSVAVWNEEQATPISFISTWLICIKMIPLLRGPSDILGSLVLRDLDLLGRRRALIVLPYNLTLENALRLMRENQISCAPIVSSITHRYLLLFSLHLHLPLLIASALGSSPLIAPDPDPMAEPIDLEMTVGEAMFQLGLGPSLETVEMGDRELLSKLQLRQQQVFDGFAGAATPTTIGGVDGSHLTANSSNVCATGANFLVSSSPLMTCTTLEYPHQLTAGHISSNYLTSPYPFINANNNNNLNSQNLFSHGGSSPQHQNGNLNHTQQLYPFTQGTTTAPAESPLNGPSPPPSPSSANALFFFGPSPIDSSDSRKDHLLLLALPNSSKPTSSCRPADVSCPFGPSPYTLLSHAFPQTIAATHPSLFPPAPETLPNEVNNPFGKSSPIIAQGSPRLTANGQLIMHQSAGPSISGGNVTPLLLPDGQTVFDLPPASQHVHPVAADAQPADRSVVLTLPTCAVTSHPRTSVAVPTSCANGSVTPVHSALTANSQQQQQQSSNNGVLPRISFGGNNELFSSPSATQSNSADTSALLKEALRTGADIPEVLYEDDVSMQNCLLHTLLSEQRRLVLCDSETKVPFEIITPSDICRFFVTHGKLSSSALQPDLSSVVVHEDESGGASYLLGQGGNPIYGGPPSQQQHVKMDLGNANAHHSASQQYRQSPQMNSAMIGGGYHQMGVAPFTPSSHDDASRQNVNNNIKIQQQQQQQYQTTNNTPQTNNNNTKFTQQMQQTNFTSAAPNFIMEHVASHATSNTTFSHNYGLMRLSQQHQQQQQQQQQMYHHLHQPIEGFSSPPSQQVHHPIFVNQSSVMHQQQQQASPSTAYATMRPSLINNSIQQQQQQQNQPFFYSPPPAATGISSTSSSAAGVMIPSINTALPSTSSDCYTYALPNNQPKTPSPSSSGVYLPFHVATPSHHVSNNNYNHMKSSNNSQRQQQQQQQQVASQNLPTVAAASNNHKACAAPSRLPTPPPLASLNEYLPPSSHSQTFNGCLDSVAHVLRKLFISHLVMDHKMFDVNPNAFACLPSVNFTSLLQHQNSALHLQQLPINPSVSKSNLNTNLHYLNQGVGPTGAGTFQTFDVDEFSVKVPSTIEEFLNRDNNESNFSMSIDPSGDFNHHQQQQSLFHLHSSSSSPLLKLPAYPSSSSLQAALKLSPLKGEPNDGSNTPSAASVGANHLQSTTSAPVILLSHNNNNHQQENHSTTAINYNVIDSAVDSQAVFVSRNSYIDDVRNNTLFDSIESSSTPIKKKRLMKSSDNISTPFDKSFNLGIDNRKEFQDSKDDNSSATSDVEIDVINIPINKSINRSKISDQSDSLSTPVANTSRDFKKDKVFSSASSFGRDDENLNMDFDSELLQHERSPEMTFATTEPFLLRGTSSSKPTIGKGAANRASLLDSQVIHLPLVTEKSAFTESNMTQDDRQLSFEAHHGMNEFYRVNSPSSPVSDGTDFIQVTTHVFDPKASNHVNSSDPLQSQVELGDPPSFAGGHFNGNLNSAPPPQGRQNLGAPPPPPPPPHEQQYHSAYGRVSSNASLRTPDPAYLNGLLSPASAVGDSSSQQTPSRLPPNQAMQCLFGNEFHFDAAQLMRSKLSTIVEDEEQTTIAAPSVAWSMSLFQTRYGTNGNEHHQNSPSHFNSNLSPFAFGGGGSSVFGSSGNYNSLTSNLNNVSANIGYNSNSNLYYPAAAANSQIRARPPASITSVNGSFSNPGVSSSYGNGPNSPGSRSAHQQNF